MQPSNNKPASRKTILKSNMGTSLISAKQQLRETAFKALANTRHLLRSLGSRPHSLGGKLIISLTSYPPRFETLHLTIKTLLSQDVSADLVILWIHEKDLGKLPASVKKLQGQTFEIKTTPTDTKSFKKLIPTLKSYPDAYIVTADDDAYYSRNWLRQLVAQHDPRAREALGHRAHRIRVDSENNLLPYNDWDWTIKSTMCGENIFLTGVGGIFYPPGSLHEDVLNEREFLELCPSADDIWFYFMLRKNDYLCRKVGGEFAAHSWRGTQEIALGKENVDRNLNDEAIMKMLNKYGKPF